MNIVPSTSQNAILLANCGELAAAIFARIAGNEISTAVNGVTLTRDAVAQLTVTRLKTLVEIRK